MAARGTRQRLDRRAGRAATLSAALAGLLLFGIGSVQAATFTVAAVNFEFQPSSQAVNVGDVVRWTFAGDPHTVTSGTPGAPDGRFDSGIKNPGGSFQVTFDTAGTYPYFCLIHPEQMVGTIVVSEGAAPTPKPTAKPTARPTPRPTARPTAAPTAAATAARTVTPTAPPPASQGPAPTASEPVAAPSEPPTTSPTLPTASATVGGAVSPSAAQGETPDAGAAAGAGDPIPIVAGVVVLGLLVAGGLALARRSRNAA